MQGTTTDMVKAVRLPEPRSMSQAVPQQLQSQLPPADTPQSSLSMERDWSNLKVRQKLDAMRCTTT